MCVPILWGRCPVRSKEDPTFSVSYTCPLSLYVTVHSRKLRFPCQQRLWVFNTADKSSSSVFTLIFKFPDIRGWLSKAIYGFAWPGLAMFYCITSLSSSSSLQTRFYNSTKSLTAAELSWTKENTRGFKLTVAARIMPSVSARRWLRGQKWTSHTPCNCIFRAEVISMERSKACTIFPRSEAGIMGSNFTKGTDVW
jgi:hypothetical protein